jgi:deoxycytidylate deaminase
MGQLRDVSHFVSQPSKKTKISDAVYFDICAKVAENSPLKWKYGCVIAKRGHIISTGYNNYKLTPFSGIYATHAEIDALNNCKNKNMLKGASMYIVRINNKNGGPRGKYNVLSGKPCNECYIKLNKMITKYGLKNVYYTIDTVNDIL